jgi:hypothetical protein
LARRGKEQVGIADERARDGEPLLLPPESGADARSAFLVEAVRDL